MWPRLIVSLMVLFAKCCARLLRYDVRKVDADVRLYGEIRRMKTDVYCSSSVFNAIIIESGKFFKNNGYLVKCARITISQVIRIARPSPPP